MIFQKGQKAKIQDLGEGESFVVKCYIKTNLSIDMTCFGVDENNKLSDDRYMIFYNQKGVRITIPKHGSKILHPKIIKNILRDAEINEDDL